MGRRPVVAVLAIGGVLATFGCGGSADPSARATADRTLHDHAVTVGSFDFAESVLLGELYSQALEHRGIEVERAFGLGPREFVAPAIAVGLIELVPEYAGSAAVFLSRGEDIPPPDAGAAHELLARGLEPHPVRAMAAAAAENANAFVVTSDMASKHDLATLSDVAPIAGELTFGGPPECGRRALCLAGLQRVYGIEFDTVVALDPGGPLTQQALRDGGIDIGLLFSSDPVMASGEFVELIDDRGLQPAENITPIVRVEVLTTWAEDLVDAVDAVSRRLTTDELRRLNGAAAASGDPATAAAAWLDRMELT